MLFITIYQSIALKMLKYILLFTLAIFSIHQIMIVATPLPQDGFNGHSIVVHYTTSPYRDVIIQGRKDVLDD